MCRRVRVSDGQCAAPGASFDRRHLRPGEVGEVTGALSKLQFVNPHGSITITVKNADGTTTDWTFTTGSATALAERGITKVGPNALKIGEQLTVTFMPARNGAPLGALRAVKRADGTVMNPQPQNNELRNPRLSEITMASRERMMWTRVAIVATLMISVPFLSSAQDSTRSTSSRRPSSRTRWRRPPR